MPVFKGEILIGVGDAGWSETYHFSEASHAAAMTKLDAIWEAGRAMHPASVKVKVLRVSDVAVKGDSFLQPASHPAGTYSGASVFDPAVAFQVNAYSADHLSWTHWFVRGIPEVIVDPAVEPFTIILPIETEFGTAVAAYRAAVQANAMLYTKKPNPPGTLHTVAIAATGYNNQLTIRKAGRPFGLRHGRRVIV